MRDINFYLNLATKKTGIKSDRKLSELLGLHFVVVNQYRSKRSMPSDETMVNLARLAGVDPYIALLDLNTWRTSGPAQTAYKSILQKITNAAVIICVIMGISAVNDRVSAASSLLNDKSASVSYDN